jgi:ABC-type transport system involved in multi-copper enzyme maturation permease subunit
MLSTAGGASPGLNAQFYPADIARQIMFSFASDVQYLYVPTIVAVTAFASIGIAREVEAGFVKVALSYPIRRRDLFLVKFAGCFLISLAIFALALLSAMFLKNWTAALYVLSFPYTVFVVLGLLTCQTFYAAGVATAMAVFTRSTAASFIGSFGVLYLPVYMAQMVRLDIPFIPPESTNLFSLYLRAPSVFWREHDLLTLVGATAVPICIALVLLLASFFFFTRRYDLS